MTAEIKKGPALGQRHLQIFLLFFCIVVNYITKFNATVAVVAMTNAESTNPNFEEFDWTKLEKSYILSSFFWGYVLTQFLGGFLCRRFGVKTTLFIATFGSSLFAFAAPFCVGWGGWGIYSAIRAIQGLFQGFMFPCVHSHLASWCPVNERNRLGALANTGIECGTVMAIFLSGSVASSSLGWPGIFHVSGGIGMSWCVLWVIFAANSPAESRLISDAELNYIESSKNALKPVDEKEIEPKQKIPVPWRAILTSLPFWALLVARSSHSWGFATLQAEIPSFMKGVMHMDMKKNTLYSALPYLTMWCMSYVYLIASDILLNRGILSLTAIRKTFNSLAFWVPAVGLIAVGFVREGQTTLAIVLMTVNVGFNAGSTIGSALNTIDLSPNHAGILMGIVNTAANIVPILTPLLVGWIVTCEEDRLQWQIVFIISAAVFGAGNLFYLIFGRMQLQPWDDADFLLKSTAGHAEAGIESVKGDKHSIDEPNKVDEVAQEANMDSSTKQSIEVPL